MTKLSLSTKKFASTFSFRSSVVFVVAFLALFIASPFLYAANEFVATKVSGDPQYIVADTDGNIVERGILTSDNLQNPKSPLPADYCVVCVPKNSEVTLVNQQGKTVELVGPTVYDLWLGAQRPYGQETVGVTEGTVAVQPVVTIDGETKPVGHPVLVKEGLPISVDPCFNIIELESLDQLEEQLQAKEGRLPALKEDIELDEPSRSR